MEENNQKVQIEFIDIFPSSKYLLNLLISSGTFRK